MPDLVQFADGRQILNTYAADGRKLKTRYYTLKTALAEPLTSGEVLSLGDKPTYMYDYDVTVYAGNKEYDLAEPKHYAWLKLSRIKNAEGYVKDGMYHYYRRDHLGNNWEVWQVNGNTLSTIQRTNYYASGLPWAYKDGDGASEQPDKYNDKEFIEMHGYDMYDSQARMYDPLILRTPTPDPHAENYYSISPYVWCGNNPLNFIDPNGRDRTRYDATDDTHYSLDGTSDLNELVVLGGKGKWTAEDWEWVFTGTYEMYQEMFSEFAGMTQPQAERYWWTYYSSSFFSYWNARVAAQKKAEANYKLMWFASAFTTVSIPVGFGSGIGKGVKISRGTIPTLGRGTGNTTLYRAVSAAELEDIAKHGLRTKVGYDTGKLFAPTVKEAARFGKNNYIFLDQTPNTIIKVKGPYSVMKNSLRFHPDGMNAVSVPNDQLHKLTVTPLNYSPLIK